MGVERNRREPASPAANDETEHGTDLTQHEIAPLLSEQFGPRWYRLKSNYWKDMESVDVVGAVLMSINLDPRAIEWARAGEGMPLPLGKQLYKVVEKRIHQILAALEAGTLRACGPTAKQPLSRKSQIRLRSLMKWIDRVAKWDMPQSLESHFLEPRRVKQKALERAGSEGKTRKELRVDRDNWLFRSHQELWRPHSKARMTERAKAQRLAFLLGKEVEQGRQPWALIDSDSIRKLIRKRLERSRRK